MFELQRTVAQLRSRGWRYGGAGGEISALECKGGGGGFIRGYTQTDRETVDFHRVCTPQLNQRSPCSFVKFFQVNAHDLEIPVRDEQRP